MASAAWAARTAPVSDCYKLEGRVVTKYDTFEAYLEDAKANKYPHPHPHHVGDTTIKGVRVSTVFLGLDHSFGGRCPMLFETMVFGGQLNGEQERCSTYDEAEAMHSKWVEAVKDAEMSPLERAVREVRR